MPFFAYSVAETSGLRKPIVGNRSGWRNNKYGGLSTTVAKAPPPVEMTRLGVG